MKTPQQQKRDEDWSTLNSQVVGGESLPPATGSALFALSYDDLQEIHRLTGLVLTWKMNLPTEMINQAQEVARRMIKLTGTDAIARKMNTCIHHNDKSRERAKACPVCLQNALERIVENLADGLKWNWRYAWSPRNAADAVLRLMAEQGIIERAKHPSGGDIYRVNGKLHGRTDDITHEKFDALRKHND